MTEAGTDTVGFIEIEPDQSVLVIHEGLQVTFKTPRPCWWFRLWTRIMLGWVWRKA